MFQALRGFMLLAITFLAGIAGAQDLRAPPLLRLTDATARPVRLAALDVDARVVGGLSRTTVELTFHNPNNRVLEGEFQFPLLAGQQVTAFALDFDGKWRQAVPVERAKGQEVFEDVTRARVDPALLEATQGKNFKLRLYPLPANGQRKVSLTITERLPEVKGGTRYRLPLPAAERLDAFRFRLSVPGRAAAQVKVIRGLTPAHLSYGDGEALLQSSRADVRPEPLVEIALAEPDAAAVLTEERDGRHYFYAELPRQDFGHALRPRPARVALVWDASGSGAARDHDREFALLDAWFKAVGDTEVSLALARDRAEDGGRFRVSKGDWSALRGALEKVAYDGGTSAGAFAPGGAADAILLFSDGLTNYGEPALPAFKAPVLAVSAAAAADGNRLRHLAEKSGGAFVDLLQTSPEAGAQALRALPARLVGLRGRGATDLIASLRDPATGRISVTGILSEPQAVVDLEWRTPGGDSKRQTVKVSRGRNAGDFAAQEWARLKLAELEPDYDLHRAEIGRLGKDFSLVSRGTSLIVLDRVEDYVRYDIAPPAELHADYERLRGQARLAAEKDRAAHLEQVVARFQQKVKWWEKDFPKGERPNPAQPRKKAAGAAVGGYAPLDEQRAEALAVPQEAPAAAPAPTAARLATTAAAKSSADAADAAPATIQLKKWTPDAPYAERLRKADAKDLYAVYLDERPDFSRSTAFFLDAADIFFERGQPALALRILSNLAEMDLENRHILRILGYRLLQAKQPALAVPVLARVLELAPNEPQSWRDLGLARAQNGQLQQALDNLYEVVRRPWHDRFPDIELIALAELNALVATAAEKPDTSAIDPRLLRNLPLDLRAVLTWDADNTDIDLWVTDPNGEKAYYGNRLTYQGGAMSRDFTGGYGPEEFSLKTAKPGKYLVQAQFYGHRQQVVSSATTLQLRLTTGFGTARQRDQAVTLRLKGSGEVVTVGEFVVGEAAR